MSLVYIYIYTFTAAAYPHKSTEHAAELDGVITSLQLTSLGRPRAHPENNIREFAIVQQLKVKTATGLHRIYRRINKLCSRASLYTE